MPRLGEVKRGREIAGFKGSHKYQWEDCWVCGKERWVILHRGEPRYHLCHPCFLGFMFPLGEGNPNWKGGRIIGSNGYIKIKLQPSDFFYSMANVAGYVLEHRLIVAKHLGRKLHSWEIVHHKGTKYPKGSIEDKQDNRYPENLQLVSNDGHNQITIMEKIIAKQAKRIVELRRENRLLKEADKYIKGEVNES